MPGMRRRMSWSVAGSFFIALTLSFCIRPSMPPALAQHDLDLARNAPSGWNLEQGLFQANGDKGLPYDANDTTYMALDPWNCSGGACFSTMGWSDSDNNGVDFLVRSESDRHHATPHWDYNPWDAWNSPWGHR